MCTWLAVETIDYFSRNGSDVFTCVMDMTKAFDHVRQSTLFGKAYREEDTGNLRPPIIEHCIPYKKLMCVGTITFQKRFL